MQRKLCSRLLVSCVDVCHAFFSSISHNPGPQGREGERNSVQRKERKSHKGVLQPAFAFSESKQLLDVDVFLCHIYSCRIEYKM